MNVSRNQVSLGALALVLSLAFPMGVLSLLSPATTGDQVDAADTIAVASVDAMQVLPDSGRTVLELGFVRYIAGSRRGTSQNLVVTGRPAVEVGDQVLVLLADGPEALLGTYLVQKNQVTREYEVATPITGMWTEGIGELPPVTLSILETAIKVRRGVLDPAALTQALALAPSPADAGLPTDGSEILALTEGGPSVPPDSFEPNDTLAAATAVVLDPPKLITGTPIAITGLTLTAGDVDFFAFNGAALSILHAETVLPEDVTGVNLDLDTILGLFDANSGDLLDWDDDSGEGALSRLISPIPSDGVYAVAVESAPDTTLDFGVGEGETEGAYELRLELERASFLTNFTELVVGVSPDGTFIEDFIGFREVDGPDVLLAGAATDGWGLTYDALIPGGLTSVNQGAGGHPGDPGFDDGLPVIPGSFVLGPFVDGGGFNRAGFARSSSLVPYQLLPRRGVLVTTEYTLGLDDTVLNGTIELKSATTSRVLDLVFTRLMDVDLFGSADPGSTSDDHFFWHFDPAGVVKAFAAPAGENVNSITEPAQGDDDDTGDFQVALVIENGDIGGGGGVQGTEIYGAAFTLVSGLLSEAQARQLAEDNLVESGAETWVIAVDQDPSTPGLFTAFGAGLRGPIN